MIYGERIRLRALTRTDIPQAVQWINDPEVTAGLLLVFPFSIEDEEKWFDQMMQTPQAEHPLAIEIHEGDKWVHIGNVGLHNLDWRSSLAEIGIVIGEKAYWNKGYGAEAISLITQHGFETLNLNRIYLHVFASNPRAVHCYEKIGFIHEGKLRQAMYKNGQYIDILVMSVLKSEWENEKSKS
jgi:RimJ/RimL family protein N-acetyltransferase